MKLKLKLSGPELFEPPQWLSASNIQLFNRYENICCELTWTIIDVECVYVFYINYEAANIESRSVQNMIYILE